MCNILYFWWMGRWKNLAGPWGMQKTFVLKRQRQQVSPEHWHLYTRVPTQCTADDSAAAMRTSDLTLWVINLSCRNWRVEGTCVSGKKKKKKKKMMKRLNYMKTSNNPSCEFTRGQREDQARNICCCNASCKYR